MKPIVIVLLLTFSIIFASNAKYYYVTHKAYVRAGAGPNYKAIGIVNNGGTVEVVEISGSWAKISHNNKYGFINAKFLNEIQPPANNNQERPFGVHGLIGGAIGIIFVFFMIRELFVGNRGISRSYGPTVGGASSPSPPPYNPNEVNAEIKDANDLKSGKRKFLGPRNYD